MNLKLKIKELPLKLIEIKFYRKIVP